MSQMIIMKSDSNLNKEMLNLRELKMMIMYCDLHMKKLPFS